MENHIIYGNQTGGKPHFLVAYKIFVDSLAQQDTKTLEKMCEKSFFHNLMTEKREMDVEKIAYFQIQPPKMQMGCTLIDTKTIVGAYIDRLKNPNCTLVSEGKDKIIYKREYKEEKEEEVQQDLSRGRLPFDGLTKTHPEKSPNSIQIVQVDL